MSEHADRSGDPVGDEPIAMSGDRYDRIVEAAGDVVPSVSSWIWEHREDLVGDEFNRIPALLERLPVGNRDALLRLIRHEPVGARHDLLVRIDVEVSVSVDDGAPGPERSFGTPHHDFMGALEVAEVDDEKQTDPEAGRRRIRLAPRRPNA